MARRRTDEPTIGECAVVALVNAGATHGIAVAHALAPDGAVGPVWSMPRPLVHRALDILENGGRGTVDIAGRRYAVKRGTTTLRAASRSRPGSVRVTVRSGTLQLTGAATGG